MSSVEELKEQVDRIRVHTDRDGNPSLKKPLLLLLVLSKMEKGDLEDNRIRFEDISDELSSLIRQFGGRDVRGGAGTDQPFVYMSTAPFWELHLPPDAPEKAADQRKRRVLTDPQTYAAFTSSAYKTLSTSSARKELANAILGRWWKAEDQSALRQALDLV